MYTYIIDYMYIYIYRYYVYVYIYIYIYIIMCIYIYIYTHMYNIHTPRLSPWIVLFKCMILPCRIPAWFCCPDSLSVVYMFLSLGHRCRWCHGKSMHLSCPSLAVLVWQAHLSSLLTGILTALTNLTDKLWCFSCGPGA